MEVRLPSRFNGLSWPPHPLQFLVIGVLIFFGLNWFCVNVPNFPTAWQPAGHTVMAVVLILHFVTYAIATIINPADDYILSKEKKGASASLDRSLHKHAIEDGFCYLCESSVKADSKHCYTCNKCVEGFDHHCIWLNNCVGRKNYRTFIVCLSSGLLGAVIIFSVNLMQFIAYFTDADTGNILLPYALLLKSSVTTTASTLLTTASPQAQFMMYFSPVPFEAFLFMVFFTAVLAFIAMVLIGHLLGLHIFLGIKGRTTYQHILYQRTMEAEAAERKETDLEMQQDINDQTSTSTGCFKNILPRKKGTVYPHKPDSSDTKTTLPPGIV